MPNKATSAILAASVCPVLFWILSVVWKVVVPPEVAVAATNALAIIVHSLVPQLDVGSGANGGSSGNEVASNAVDNPAAANQIPAVSNLLPSPQVAQSIHAATS
jgi:hypothetical protein